MSATPDAPPAAKHPADAWDCHVHVFDAGAPVLAGHYRPAARTLQEIEVRAAAHGVNRLVLVQPSVYGTDNSLLLTALQASDGRHRGIAVVASNVSEQQLNALHAAGVRGIRLNAVSPVGVQADPAALNTLAPRLLERGWHVQWYVRRAELAALVPLQRSTGLRFVLDHLAGMDVTAAADDPAWPALAALADAESWIKLSGWYRLGAARPYDSLHANIQRVAKLFGTRCVWGSDWPHTQQPDAAELAYEALWRPVVGALGDEAAAAVRGGQAGELYG